ncbi:MAG: pyrroline-5-carboxylate reductase [Gammaproteobacteria bacterium]
MTRVLMAGCGNMGGALLSQWLQQPGFEFTVISPSNRRCPDGVRVENDVSKLEGQQFDLIVVAVKPQLINDVIPAYTNLLAADGCFVSMAAGFSVSSLEKLIGLKNGPVPVIRIMPNMPVSIGKGVSALYANDKAGQSHKDRVADLMQATGQLIWVADEDAIDRFTAIAGSGPGYAFEIARCWVQAGQALGFSEQEAKEMVLQTLLGSAEMALASDSSLADLRNGVTSKNGTTAAGLNALNGGGDLDRLLQQTLDAAYSRAVELR